MIMMVQTFDLDVSNNPNPLKTFLVGSKNIDYCLFICAL